MNKTEFAYGTLFPDGSLEVESNDRELRITLSRVSVFQDGKHHAFYRSAYFVKDGFEWQRTSETAKFKNTEEFLKAISNSQDFTNATKEIALQKESLGLAGSRNV